ncbi:hypothetical protein C8R43DRAFT_1099217 [Mycena crocata]|nr:hypothetical protein C8R43DRAFT_1099217 [Mycena crocata]
MFGKLGSQSAAWSVKEKEHYDVKDFRQDPITLLFKCRICPITVGDHWMSTKRLKEHVPSKKHLNSRKIIAQRRKAARSSSRSPSAPTSASTTEAPLCETQTATVDSDRLGDGTAAPCMHVHSDGETATPCPHVHSPIQNTTDLSADPFVQFVPDPSASQDVPAPEEFSRFGWTDSSGRRVFFSAGSEESDPLAESLARALRGTQDKDSIEVNVYTEDLAREDPLFCDDDTDTDGITAEELNSRLFGPDASSEWFPYPDKAAFLTDVLFSSPRLRFSRAQQKAVLSWAKDLGATVPTYLSFRKTQDALLAEVGDPTRRQESGRGNVWYLNEIGDSIKKDMANPFTRSGMTLYPEDAGNQLGEVWHGDKMLRDIPDHLLSPTVRHNGVIYYVDELVQCKQGRWFLPKRWLTRGKVMFASGHHVTESDDGLVVDDATRNEVEVSSFMRNFIQILDENGGIYPLSSQSDEFAKQMPHPLRERAGSRMVYSIPLAVFIDDVSGNKSKQWNKHFSCYMSNGALPRSKLENEFHVRFVATSPFASPLEIMQGVRASIEDTFTEPVVAWDCETKEEVLLRSYGLLFAGDNPMQAELCSCAGLNTNFFCRTCKAGGTREWKQSNEGFAGTGVPRDSVDTAEETFQQILTALEPNIATTLTEAVRASGVKDALAQPIIDVLVKLGQDLRKANPDGTSRSPDEVQTILTEELKKHQQKGEGITNPLFDMDGIDMHKDTPTEILHTILLGVVKYYWGQTIWLLEKGQDFSLFQTRLNSIVSDGLNVTKIQGDYMCQYRGGLIGKHFKTLSQIMAFAVQGLVPPDVLEAWLILGRLTVLLWHTKIDDVGTYTTDLEQCIDDFINITCKCSPSILISKPKFHFLLHLPFFIRRFGPAVLFSTERYEAYNAVFRACSIYSNRLTPSRDIAWSFAGIDRVKHIVTGGWWRDSKTGLWTCAKPRVMRHILDHPEMAAMVGLPTKAVHEPGMPYLWSTEPSKSARFPLGAASRYKTMKGLVACTGDKTFTGQNIIFRHEGGQLSPLSFGTIQEIISSLPADLGSSAEREKTSITRPRIKHTDDIHFIVNTASLHNYQQILSAIPTSLSPHSFTVADQTSLRLAAAVQIREKNSEDGAGVDELIRPLTELDVLGPEVENGPAHDENPDGEIETPTITVLENPIFSRVGTSRARTSQPLKQAPSTL